MPAKKQPAKTNALALLKEQFAPYAKQAKEQVKAIGGEYLTIQFGRDKITVGEKTQKELDCVIIGAVAHNRFFKTQYNPNDPTPPDCYAFGEDVADEDMAPHSAVKHPESELCATCDNNVFGSADTGRGKACANTIRLGLLLAKDCESPEEVRKAVMGTASVSPTNLKRYKKYVDRLVDDYELPPFCFVSTVSSIDDPETQIRVEWELGAAIEDPEILKALAARWETAKEGLIQPYSAAATASKGTPRKKAVPPPKKAATTAVKSAAKKAGVKLKK